MAALVVALFLVNSSYSHPGAVTLVPVAATASTILFSKGGNLIVKLLQLRILVVLGLISYPLYLWHWPLLTFTRITFGESLSILNSLFVIAISIVAAGLTFYFVERNIKKIKNKKGLSLTLLLLLLSIGSSGFILSKLEFFKVRLSEYSSLTNAVKWDNHWSDLKCQQSLKLYPCKITSQQPKVHIFGDSHGNHLFPGLEKIFDKSILAGGSCAPFEHIKVVPSKNKHLLPCHDSQSVTQNLELLSHFRSIEIVVLSYFTYPVLTGKFTDNATEELFGSTDLISSFPQDKGLKRDELFFRGISRTIRKIEETSKQVIFVRDTPFVFNDLFSFCNISRLKLDGISNCYISKNDFLKVREPEERFVRRLRTEFPDVAVVDPIESFCDKSNCYFIKNGIPFFRDNHHLSISGSELLARQIRKEFEQKFDNSSDI